MKNFKKAMSVLLVAAILMSVCTCLLSTVGAYTLKSATTETLLTLDFENETGIADVRQDHSKGVWSTTYETDNDDHGKYVLITNGSYQGYSIVLGNKDAVMAQSSTTVQHPDRFQVPYAGTFTLKLDYKILEGSAQTNAVEDDGSVSHAIKLDTYKCGVAQPGASISKTGNQIVANYEPKEGEYTETTITDSKGVERPLRTMTKDSDWYTVEKTFTFTADDIAAGRTSICLSTTAGTSAGDAGQISTTKVAIDNVSVVATQKDTSVGTTAKGTTYVYDFKDANGTMMTAYGDTMTDYNFGTDGSAEGGCHTWFSYSDSSRADNTQSFVSNNGVVLFTNSMAPSITTSSGSWVTKLYLKDPDFKVGNGSYGFLRMEAGHYYHVEAYVKAYYGKAVDGTTDLTHSANFNAGIALSSKDGGASYNTIGAAVSKTIDHTKTDATVISVDLDADDTSWTGKNTSNDATPHSTNVGRYIGITSQSGHALLVEKVVVTVYDKNAFAESANQISVDFDNGLNDIYMPNGQGLGIGDIAVTSDPTNKGKGNVLEYTASGIASTLTVSVPSAPGLGAYATETPLSSYAEGFAVKAGHKYKITFDSYLSENIDGYRGYEVYLASKSGVCVSGSKTKMVVADAWGNSGNLQKNNAGTGNWTTVTMSFTATEAAVNAGHIYPCIGICTNASTDEYSMIHYMDNITITDITNIAGTSVDNAKTSIRAEESGLNYVSAGIRFRGSLATATAEAADEIGFIVAPENLVNAYTGTDKWFTVTGDAAALSSAKIAKVKTASEELLYSTDGTNNDYQVLIKGLTKEGVDVDMLGTQFTVVMYTKTGDTYTYYDVATASYYEVRNAYGEQDAANLAKY